MRQEQTALQAPLFSVGQDSHGNWVVQDQSGTRGGLFVDRLDALRYVRSENANCMNVYVAVGGIFELDMTRAGTSGQKSSSELHSARKVA